MIFEDSTFAFRSGDKHPVSYTHLDVYKRQEMTDNALVRRWWDYMADVIVVEADNAPVSEELPELFYME